MKTIKTLTLVTSILFIYSTAVFCQNIKPENVVDVSSKSTLSKTKYGTEVALDVILGIKDSWHINANKPLDESLTPTVIKFDKSKDFAVQGMKYPPAEMVKLSFSENELAVYEMQATVKTKLLVSKNFKGKTLTVKGSVQYQPCNNQTCLFPVSKPFTLELKLK